MAEKYSGIKFKTITTGNEIPCDARLPELKYWCRIFHEKNLAPPYEGGSYGNLSFRLNHGDTRFIITGTCIGLKDSLDDDKFVLVEQCDLKNLKVYVTGTRKPSSESLMHYLIYQKRPEINAVFHGHSPEILLHAPAMKIPSTRKEIPYGTVHLAIRVSELAGKYDFFVIKNHGFVSLGKTLSEAGERTLHFLGRARDL